MKDRSAKPRAVLLVLLRSRQLPVFNGWCCAFPSGPERRGFRIGAARHRSPWFTVRLPGLRRLRETDRLESNISTDLYWLATRNSRVGSTNSQALCVENTNGSVRPLWHCGPTVSTMFLTLYFMQKLICPKKVITDFTWLSTAIINPTAACKPLSGLVSTTVKPQLRLPHYWDLWIILRFSLCKKIRKKFLINLSYC